MARAAHQQGALTIAVVTRPFSFEGPQRAASAALGIENLRKEVDALIVIPNDRLLELSDRTIGIVDAFKTADTALLAGVQGITDLISSNSYIHVDFNDVNAILRGAGTALFGIGSARGEDRATQAAEIAISSPLLEESIEGAHGALINIAGPSDLKLQEAAAATQLVGKAIHPEAQIIWGLSLDDAYGDEVRVTVIAAGFDANSKKAAQAEAQKQAEPAESTVPLSALSAAPRAAAVPQQPSLSLFRLRKPRRCSRCPLIFRPLRNPSFRHSTRPPSMKWCLRTTPAIWIFRISCAKSNAKTRKDRSWQVL